MTDAHIDQPTDKSTSIAFTMPALALSFTVMGSLEGGEAYAFAVMDGIWQPGNDWAEFIGELNAVGADQSVCWW